MVIKPDQIRDSLWNRLSEEKRRIVVELVQCRDSPVGSWFDLVGKKWTDQEWLTYLNIVVTATKITAQ